ncbi:hypothetical protein X975_26833, partial [Stegodyphus mimosarum]
EAQLQILAPAEKDSCHRFSSFEKNSKYLPLQFSALYGNGFLKSTVYNFL